MSDALQTIQVTKWDPLKSSFSEEVIGATIKRQIKNILKSYTGWYDPLCELIQNALDAVDTRKKLGEPGYVPTIHILIDMSKNQLSVTDNGIGFKEPEFRNFLAPNVSFKKGDTRGNKGVGATYLGYGFNFLQVGTKTEDFSFMGTLKGGKEWVEDESNIKTRPEIQEDSVILHSAFEKIDRGSTFTLKFIGDSIRPKDLKWVGANTADQWSVVLRIKTPLGGMYFDNVSVERRCILQVVDESGKVTDKVVDSCEYVYPHMAISQSKDLKEVHAKQMELLNLGKDASKLPESFSRLNALYRTWSKEEILSNAAGLRLSLDEKERELISKYDVTLYSFFCYSTDLWNKYNDEVIGLRKGGRILRGGLQLATNNMPQGDSLMIPLTKNIGFQNVTHAIVHFKHADPDLGRKGFQPELRDLALDLASSSVKVFLAWKKLLRSETGAPPDIVAEKNVHEWIKAQEEHERREPLKIDREDLFLPIKEPSITSLPLNEQDVVSLFNQLLAGGVIRGIKIMSTSQHQQYDGVYKFWIKPPFSNHIFDKQKNPLGIEQNRFTEEFSSAPMILEYKYCFDALLEEFEKEEKHERDIKLIIAWNMGTEWKKRYSVTPLLHFDNFHHRPFHGATHIFRNSVNNDLVFYGIILDELINYINNPESVQSYQKETYISEN